MLRTMGRLNHNHHLYFFQSAEGTKRETKLTHVYAKVQQLCLICERIGTFYTYIYCIYIKRFLWRRPEWHSLIHLKQAETGIRQPKHESLKAWSSSGFVLCLSHQPRFISICLHEMHFNTKVFFCLLFLLSHLNVSNYKKKLHVRQKIHE